MSCHDEAPEIRNTRRPVRASRRPPRCRGDGAVGAGDRIRACPRSGTPSHAPRRRNARPGAVAAILAAATLAACAGASSPGAPNAREDACIVVAGPSPSPTPSDASRPVVIGIDGPVDPAHAPVPHSPAERLVFAQLYQPLVRPTCDGRVERLLAERWRMEQDGRVWTFTLRRDSRGWDGEPITAADVAASWSAAREAGRITDIAALDARTVYVELAEPDDIEFFSRPELSVRRRAAGSSWPVGTGPYRPVAPGSPGGLVTLAPRGAGPELEVREVGDDARNALDAGVDLLVTRDPSVIDYAAAAPDLLSVPLAWDRTYLLLAPVSHPEADAAGEPPLRWIRPPASALASLARDAVRVDARPARILSADQNTCVREARSAAAGDDAARRSPGGEARRAVPTHGARRIVYLAGDAVAQALAERLVALARDPHRPDAAWLADAVPALTESAGPIVAVGLSAPVFAEAVRRGDDVAYVQSVDRAAVADACGAPATYRLHVPWLGPAAPATKAGVPTEGATTAPTAAATNAIVVPLIETRQTLIVRRGVGGVAVDGSGTLRLDALRREASSVGGAVPAPSAEPAPRSGHSIAPSSSTHLPWARP